MPPWIVLPLAIAGVLAIFLTTPLGRRLMAALGIHGKLVDRVPAEDRDFLLRVCGGDPVEVERRLAAARGANARLDLAQQYRKAIRSYMNSRSTVDPSADDPGRAG
jgi:hypothetical protein